MLQNADEANNTYIWSKADYLTMWPKVATEMSLISPLWDTAAVIH